MSAPEISRRAQAASDDACGEVNETLDFYFTGLSDETEKAIVAFAVAGIVVGRAMDLLARVCPSEELKGQMDAFVARCFRLPGTPA